MGVYGETLQATSVGMAGGMLQPQCCVSSTESCFVYLGRRAGVLLETAPDCEWSYQSPDNNTQQRNNSDTPGIESCWKRDC